MHGILITKPPDINTSQYENKLDSGGRMERTSRPKKTWHDTFS